MFKPFLPSTYSLCLSCSCWWLLLIVIFLVLVGDSELKCRQNTPKRQKTKPNRISAITSRARSGQSQRAVSPQISRRLFRPKQKLWPEKIFHWRLAFFIKSVVPPKKRLRFLVPSIFKTFIRTQNNTQTHFPIATVTTSEQVISYLPARIRKYQSRCASKQLTPVKRLKSFI